jgi:hypothetical protein
MEPTTIAAIASAAITVLKPFVEKGLEKLAEKTAEEGFNERKAIWEKVKGLFKADDLTLLNLLKEADADERAQGKLEGKLETYLEANPVAATELEELLSRLPATQVKQNTMNITGNSNIAVQDVSGSTVNINK